MLKLGVRPHSTSSDDLWDDRILIQSYINPYTAPSSPNLLVLELSPKISSAELTTEFHDLNVYDVMEVAPAARFHSKHLGFSTIFNSQSYMSKSGFQIS